MFLVALAATKAAARYEGCRQDEIRKLEENVRESCPEYHFHVDLPLHLVLDGTIKATFLCTTAVDELAKLVGKYACTDSDVERHAPHLLELRKMSQTLQSTRLSSASTLGAPRLGKKMPNADGKNLKKLERLLSKGKKGGKLAARHAKPACTIAKLLFNRMKKSKQNLKRLDQVVDAIDFACGVHDDIRPIIEEELQKKKARRAKKAARTEKEAIEKSAQDRVQPSAPREKNEDRMPERVSSSRRPGMNAKRRAERYLRLGDEWEAEEEFSNAGAARWDYEF